jgi:uncharacterized protein (TIGR02145 family)
MTCMKTRKVQPACLFFLTVLVVSLTCACNNEDENILTDIDGNEYSTVTIGDQVWMTENLRVINYSDGEAITPVTDAAEWAGLSTPAYCWYDNNESIYKNPYGAMYNWHAVNTGKLCPTGWHVPTDDEWKSLAEYAGGDTIAGGKLKEADTAHWASPNTGATNEFDFNALPGGGHYYNGAYGWMGYYGTYWTSTEASPLAAWSYYMQYNSDALIRGNYDKKVGYSVRCLKD